MCKQVELNEAEADLLYGMLTQRLYLRDDDPERELVVDVREAIYPATSANRERLEAAHLLSRPVLAGQNVTWEMVLEVEDCPNPVVGQRPAPGGGSARLYQDGMVDAVDGDLYSVSPGFSSFSELAAWYSDERARFERTEARS